MYQYAEKWWLILLQGIALMLLGFFALFWPGITLVTLTAAFGLFLLADGAINIIDGFMLRKQSSMWFLEVVWGAILIFGGVFVLRYTEMTLALLAMFIAFSFLVRGIFEIVFAFDKDNENKTLGFLMGILGILAGIIIFLYPVQGTLAYVWVIGAFALINGPLVIAYSFSLRSLMDESK